VAEADARFRVATIFFSHTNNIHNGNTIPNGQKIPHGYEIYQMVIQTPNGCKICQVTKNYTNMFHSKALHNISPNIHISKLARNNNHSFVSRDRFRCSRLC
jgi:hypothetical protein